MYYPSVQVLDFDTMPITTSVTYLSLLVHTLPTLLFKFRSGLYFLFMRLACDYEPITIFYVSTITLLNCICVLKFIVQSEGSCGFESESWPPEVRISAIVCLFLSLSTVMYTTATCCHWHSLRPCAPFPSPSPRSIVN